MSKITAIVTKNTITATIGDDPTLYQSDTSNRNFSRVTKAYREQNVEDFLKYIDPNYNETVQTVSQDVEELKIVNGNLHYKGYEVSKTLSDRIIEMKSLGYDVSHMLKFLDNLHQNPSKTSVDELYDFLSNTNIPITDDGCFMSYKSLSIYQGDSFVDVNGREVKSGDYVDSYTKKIRNNIGDYVEMPRNKVDDDRRRDCSYGYHTGGLDYVTNSYRQDIVVVTKTNPKDVVSVPLEYSAQKLRTCAYTVLSVYKSPLNKPIYEASDELEFDEVVTKDKGYVSFDELDTGYEIKFEYDGQLRHVYIENLEYSEYTYHDDDYDDDEEDMGYITGLLLPKDPSFTGKELYRTFKESKMTKIQII